MFKPNPFKINNLFYRSQPHYVPQTVDIQIDYEKKYDKIEHIYSNYEISNNNNNKGETEHRHQKNKEKEDENIIEEEEEMMIDDNNIENIYASTTEYCYADDEEFIPPFKCVCAKYENMCKDFQYFNWQKHYNYQTKLSVEDIENELLDWPTHNVACLCRNDNEPINGPAFGVAVIYNTFTSKYIMIGYFFCSEECAARWAKCNLPHTLFKNAIRLMQEIRYKRTGSLLPIIPAPDCGILAKYDVHGKGLTIEEYRKLNNVIIRELNPLSTSSMALHNYARKYESILPDDKHDYDNSNIILQKKQ